MCDRVHDLPDSADDRVHRGPGLSFPAGRKPTPPRPINIWRPKTLSRGWRSDETSVSDMFYVRPEGLLTGSLA